MSRLSELGESAARWLGRLSLVGLIGAGILRPLLPEALRGRWVLLVLGLAFAGVAAQIARLRLRPTADLHRQALWLLLPLLLSVMYLQPARVGSDGIFYFGPLRSVLVDGDLDFENEYRTLGALPGYFQRTPTGRLPNNFSIGPALAWSPLYALVHASARLGLFRPTGYGYPYFTAVATSGVLLGFLGILWTYRLIRFYLPGEYALLAATLLALGSSHLWYMTFEPSMSHAPAMAAVSGFLLLSHRGASGARQYALCGAAGGLVMLMRWQNALFLPVALATGWARAREAGRRPSLREIASFLAASGLVFLPQAIFWKLIYGSFLLVPQGASYLRLSEPQLLEVLFSSRHGLFSWSPLLWLGLAGLVGFVRRAPVFGWGLLAALSAATYLNASVQDWWAGASFGARRFDGALPLFGIGLAVAAERLTAWVRRRPLAGVGLGLAPFLLWNWMLVGLYASGSIPLDGALSWRQAAADGLELFYRRTGYPFSWPGALAERFRRGVPLAAYELAGARRGANNLTLRLGDSDALHLGTGWSLPRRRSDRTYREVFAGEAARLYVDLNEPAPYRLSVEARGGSALRVEFNGETAGRLDLTADWTSFSLDIPRDWVLSGLNRLSFFPEGAERAAVSRLSLVRPGEP